jgi:CDGSH-type Zn-finger protein
VTLFVGLPCGMRAEPTGRITVTENGPYKIEGSLPIRSAKGEDVSREAPFFLCRCGQSQNKPFCDGSHSLVGFRDG